MVHVWRADRCERGNELPLDPGGQSAVHVHQALASPDPGQSKSKASAHSPLAPWTATRLGPAPAPHQRGDRSERGGPAARPTPHATDIASRASPCRAGPAARVRGEHARARGVGRIRYLVRVAPPPRRSAPAGVIERVASELTRVSLCQPSENGDDTHGSGNARPRIIIL